MAGGDGGLGTAILVLTVILIIVVAMVVLWVVRKKREAAESRDRTSAELSEGSIAQQAAIGGDPSPQPGGGFESNSSRDVSAVTSAALRPSFDSLMDAHSSGTHPPGQMRAVVGGGTEKGTELGRPALSQASRTQTSAKKKVKPWREYETWEELGRDKAASQHYWKECGDFLNHLPKDWSKVREAAKEMIADDREWAGHIDIIKGVPEIVSKYRSSTGQEDDDMSARRASVSSDVSKKVWSKPGLIAFHTHPADKALHPDFDVHPPSPPDLALAVTEGFHGQFAAQVVLSPQAIFVYGLNGNTVTQLWNSEHPYFYAARLSYDVYSSIAGTRSYVQSRRIDEDEKILDKFGMFYFIIPEDGFAQSLYNTRSRWGCFVDIGDLKYFTKRLETAQNEIFKEKQRKSKKRKDLKK